MKKPATNAAAFDRVLSHFYVNGKRHGAKNAMGVALGCSSRQVPDRWERYGIPRKYAAQLQELTGMKPHEIWPENFKRGRAVE